MIEIEKLLENPEENKEKLISYILKVEAEITIRVTTDKTFKPHDEDEYQERRDLLWKIRNLLNISYRASDLVKSDIAQFRQEILENSNTEE